jgi:hypothetical protein
VLVAVVVVAEDVEAGIAFVLLLPAVHVLAELARVVAGALQLRREGVLRQVGAPELAGRVVGEDPVVVCVEPRVHRRPGGAAERGRHVAVVEVDALALEQLQRLRHRPHRRLLLVVGDDQEDVGLGSGDVADDRLATGVGADDRDVGAVDDDVALGDAAGRPEDRQDGDEGGAEQRHERDLPPRDGRHGQSLIPIAHEIFLNRS